MLNSKDNSKYIALLKNELLYICLNGLYLDSDDISNRDERLEKFKNIVSIIEKQNINKNTIKSIFNELINKLNESYSHYVPWYKITYVIEYAVYIKNILLKNNKPKEIYIDQDNIRHRLYNIVSNRCETVIGESKVQAIVNLWNFIDNKELIFDIIDSGLKAFLHIANLNLSTRITKIYNEYYNVGRTVYRIYKIFFRKNELTEITAESVEEKLKFIKETDSRRQTWSYFEKYTA